MPIPPHATPLLKLFFLSKISWLISSINNHNKMCSPIFRSLTGRKNKQTNKTKGEEKSLFKSITWTLVDKKCSLYRCFIPEWRKKILENKNTLNWNSNFHYQHQNTLAVNVFLIRMHPPSWLAWMRDSQCWVLPEHRVPRNVCSFKQLVQSKLPSPHISRKCRRQVREPYFLETAAVLCITPTSPSSLLCHHLPSPLTKVEQYMLTWTCEQINHSS